MAHAIAARPGPVREEPQLAELSDRVRFGSTSRILVRRQPPWGDILLVRLEASSEDPVPILELHHWLRLDPDARRFADPRLVARDAPTGAMGAVDVINLVLSQGFSAANLALAYASWRSMRIAAPSVTISCGGGSITVTDASEETVRRIIECLSAADSIGGNTRNGEDGRPLGGTDEAA